MLCAQWRQLAVLAGLSLLVSAGVAGCAAEEPTVFSGTVRDDVVRVEAPSLETTASASTGERSLVTTVAVAEGDSVKAGQIVAVLDERLLRAALDQARTAARAARSDIGVIGARIEDTAEGGQTLAERRSDLVATIADLERTRSQLVARRAQARGDLAELRRIPLLPPGSTPPALPPGAPDPNAVRTTIARLQAGIAQMDAGIARLDSGLARAREGLRRIDAARDDLAEARERLKDLEDVAEVGAETFDVAVDLAAARLELATLRSPVDGAVVSAVRPGSVLAPGAAAVIVRPSGPQTVRLWLPPYRLQLVSLGMQVDVRVDALRRALPARVATIGSSAEFPPSSLATSEIHLIRAVAVDVRLDEDVRLPAGIPADVTIPAR